MTNSRNALVPLSQLLQYANDHDKRCSYLAPEEKTKYYIFDLREAVRKFVSENISMGFLTSALSTEGYNTVRGLIKTQLVRKKFEPGLIVSLEYEDKLQPVLIVDFNFNHCKGNPPEIGSIIDSSFFFRAIHFMPIEGYIDVDTGPCFGQNFIDSSQLHFSDLRDRALEYWKEKTSTEDDYEYLARINLGPIVANILTDAKKTIISEWDIIEQLQIQLSGQNFDEGIVLRLPENDEEYVLISLQVLKKCSFYNGYLKKIPQIQELTVIPKRFLILNENRERTPVSLTELFIFGRAAVRGGAEKVPLTRSFQHLYPEVAPVELFSDPEEDSYGVLNDIIEESLLDTEIDTGISFDYQGKNYTILDFERYTGYHFIKQFSWGANLMTGEGRASYLQKLVFVESKYISNDLEDGSPIDKVSFSELQLITAIQSVYERKESLLTSVLCNLQIAFSKLYHPRQLTYELNCWIDGYHWTDKDRYNRVLEQIRNQSFFEGVILDLDEYLAVLIGSYDNLRDPGKYLIVGLEHRRLGENIEVLFNDDGTLKNVDDPDIRFRVIKADDITFDNKENDVVIEDSKESEEVIEDNSIDIENEEAPLETKENISNLKLGRAFRKLELFD